MMVVSHHPPLVNNHTPSFHEQKQDPNAENDAPEMHDMINSVHCMPFPGGPHDTMFGFDHDDVFGGMHHAAHPGQPLTIVVPPQQPHIIHAPPPDGGMHGMMSPSAASYPPGTSPPSGYFNAMAPPHTQNHHHHHPPPSSAFASNAMHDPLAEMADALNGPSLEATTPWSGPHSGSAGPSMMPSHPSGGPPPMHSHGAKLHPTHSMPAHASLQPTATGGPNDGHPAWPGFGQPFVVPDVADNGAHGGGEDDHTSDLLRGVGLSPSPPPLPPDWDVSVKPSGLLFDFDSFNVSKQQHSSGGRPFVTVTSSMNPTDMMHPSDDYIMQVLCVLGCFEGCVCTRGVF